MVDLALFSAALSSLNSATDIAKLIKDSGNSLEQAEVKLKLAELISALADAKLEIADIQGNLIEKDQQIQALKEKFELREQLVFENRCYWKASDNDERDGPFCQRCFDVDEKLVRLQHHKMEGGQRIPSSRWWGCTACGKNYDA